MPTLSGTVKDANGVLAQRLVRVYKKSTGAFVGEVASDATTGVWSIATADTTDHFAVAHHTTAITTGDTDFASVSLLLNMDGTNGSTTFTDSSLSPKTVTVAGNAQLSTGVVKNGTASALFDGTGDEITATLGTFGTANFTIEAHVYPVSKVQSYPCLLRITDGTNTLYVQHNSDSRANQFYINDGTTSAGTATQANGAWYHVAVVRSSGTLTLYVDGVSTGSFSHSRNYGAITFKAGGSAAEAGSLSFNGHLDNLRVTQGVARYTTTFTPPAAAFPNYTIDATFGNDNAIILDRLTPV